MSDNAAPILSREEIGELKMFITAHRALAGTRVNDILYSHEAQREEIQCLTESRDAISALFPDDAPHKHTETGVSLLDDVRDLIAERKRIVATVEAMANILGGEGPELPKLVDDIVAAEKRLMDELSERNSYIANYEHATKIERAERDAELSALRAELAEAKDTLKEHEEEHWCFNAEHGQVIIERGGGKWSEDEKCECCRSPDVRHHDVEGVPLCVPCFQELSAMEATEVATQEPGESAGSLSDQEGK